jgi:hypothetical protein
LTLRREWFGGRVFASLEAPRRVIAVVLGVIGVP